MLFSCSNITNIIVSTTTLYIETNTEDIYKMIRDRGNDLATCAHKKTL